MKLIRKFYRRHGDKASCRDWTEKSILCDGSTLNISISLILYPKRPFVVKHFEWFLSISNFKSCGYKTASDWKNFNSTKIWKKNIKKIIELAKFNSNKLTNHNFKQRKKIIDGWFNQVLKTHS